MSRDEAIMRGKLDTRRYAKRQFTFARHQLTGFQWLSGDAPWTAVEGACSVRS
jgi:tRNA dimethylallyltransferase